jgi:hypothetical protein
VSVRRYEAVGRLAGGDIVVPDLEEETVLVTGIPRADGRYLSSDVFIYLKSQE